MGCKGLGDDTSTPIDISRTELPSWMFSHTIDTSPVVYVATRQLAVVGPHSTTVITKIVGVSRDRAVLEAMAVKDHTVSIELVEMKG